MSANMSTLEAIGGLFVDSLSRLSREVHAIFVNVSSDYLFVILTLYFTILGWKIIQGDIERNMQTILRLVVYLPIIMSFTFDYSKYLDFVIMPILTLNEYLSGSIVSIVGDGIDVSSTAFTHLDDVYFRNYTFAKENYFGYNPFNYILGVVLLGSYLLFYLQVGYYLLKSAFALSLFLMIGVVPLIAFAFNGGQHITGAWFRTVITYFLYGPMISIFVVVSYYVLSGTAIESTNDTNFLITVASNFLLAMLVKDIPEYVNALTSSMSGGGDVVSSLSGAMSSAGRGKASMMQYGKSLGSGVKAYKNYRNSKNLLSSNIKPKI